MNEPTFKVCSSNGELIANKATGEVINYDCTKEIANIIRFDVDENAKYHKTETVADEVDILDMGYWHYTQNGIEYEEPAHDWRKELVEMIKQADIELSPPKHILITLQVQNGEYRYEMPSVHTTKCKDINYAGQRHAASFYGNLTGRNEDWWEFSGCEVAVRLYSVVEITIEEFVTLNKYL